MSVHGSGRFVSQSWEEAAFSEVKGGAKVARASVVNGFHGVVEGRGRLDYLLVYLPDGSGSFVGLEQVVGAVEGRSGSFVLRHVGVFGSPGIEGTWVVAPGSAAGELVGLRGQGAYATEMGASEVPFTLDYDLG